ncbi:hypothetical protein [Algoriphagus namhaensis]
MKTTRIYLLAAFALLPFLAQAQLEVGMGYLHSTAQGPMGRNIDRAAHGYTFDLGYQLPFSRFGFGIQIGGSQYGFQEQTGTYQFSNGYEGEVNVETTHFFSTVNAFTTYSLLEEGFIQPYLQLGGGLSTISTELEIFDPRENFTSDCPKPLETSTLIRDVTPYVLLGGGMRLDLSYPFKSLERKKLLLDLRVNYLSGGEVRYLGTKENQPNTPPQGENVSFDFVSASRPDVVHEYHVGTSYLSRFELITFNAGLIFVIGQNRRKPADYLDLFY